MGQNGGKREGSGRPRKAELYKGPIRAAEDRIADKLPAIIDKLFYLAMGGFERVEEKYGYEINPTSPLSGERVEVLIERKVSYAEPDRAALMYLTDRILGKPTLAVEMTGEEGAPIEIEVSHRVLAGRELDEWRREMRESLSSGPSAPPTAPTSPTPTG